jgi:hypothetical protein
VGTDQAFRAGGQKGKRGPRSDGRLFIDALFVDGALGCGQRHSID